MSPTAQDNDTRRGLGPPQFGLGSLLLLLAVLGAMFALMNSLGAYGAFWLVVFVLAVLAHVAGNAIGTKLRDSGALPLRDHQKQSNASDDAESGAVEYAPATRLRERSTLGRPILLLTAAGVVVAGLSGGYFLASTNWEHSNPMNVAFGVFVCGVLGGIWTYLSVGFIQVTLGALIHASRDPKRQ